MKQNNFVWKILAIAGIAGVLVYFAASIAGYLLDPLTTAVAYNYRSDQGITVSGYLIRDEEVLADNSGLVYVTREEGEKVSQGGDVAVVYHSQEGLEQAQRRAALEDQLEQLEYAQTVAAGGQAVLRLDSSIREGIFTLRQAVESEDYTAAGREAENLRALVLKRDFTYSGQDDLDVQIEALSAEIQSLRAVARSNSTTITTGQGGYYSSLVDGYEAVLTPDRLQEMTAAELMAVGSDSAVSSSVGKVIHGNRWYYAAAVEPEELGKLQEGDSVTLRFVSGLEKDVPMTVFRIGEEESNGRCLLVLAADQYLSVTTLLRDQNAQVIFRSYDGIRVPSQAMRLLEVTFTDEETGEERTETVSGVYCRVGLIARFKPVEVIYQGEDYYLVAPSEEAMGWMDLGQSQRSIYTIRAGDEVIVTARDLYDGKVIEE